MWTNFRSIRFQIGRIFKFRSFSRLVRPGILAASAFAAIALIAAAQTSVRAFDVNDAKLIDQGFKLFTKGTFKGNGRTCGTCHVPQFDYNIGPADVANLSKAQLKALQVLKVPTLENQTAVQALTSFNIAEGPVGNVNNPDGPFRNSMSIGGLEFTTINMCRNSALISSITGNGTTATATLTEPTELFVGETAHIADSSISGFNVAPIVTGVGATSTLSGTLASNQFTFASAVAGTATGGSVTLGAPCPGASVNRAAGIDDGNRNIALGWSDDGAPNDPSIFPNTAASANCIAAVNAAAAHPTELFFAMRAFSLGAVRKHATLSLSRVPGSDFVCPTSSELDAMAKFQMYLGRRFELALCSNDTPGAICDGTQFGATAFATGKNGTATPFSPSVITFKDAAAETGKAIYLDGRSLCNLCHFNGGAQNTTGDIRGEPGLAPGQVVSPINVATMWTPSTLFSPAVGSPNNTRWAVVQPTDGTFPFFFLALSSSAGTTGQSGPTEPSWPTTIGDTVLDNEITWLNLGFVDPRLNTPGRNFNAETEADVLTNVGDPLAAFSGAGGSQSLNQIVAPLVLPNDDGNLILGQGPAAQNNGKQGGFNIQSLIESARKKSFFHNGSITTNIEDAVTFYFTDTFDGSASGGALGVAPAPRGRACTPNNINCGSKTVTTLANIYTAGDHQAVFNEMGFFLRGLSVVYSIADCERLVDDAIDRVNAHMPTTVQVLNCTTNLDDVARVISEAKVAPAPQYITAQGQIPALKKQLKQAANGHSVSKLQALITALKTVRQSIATIAPEI
jgi:hypothetical protein